MRTAGSHEGVARGDAPPRPTTIYDVRTLPGGGWARRTALGVDVLVPRERFADTTRRLLDAGIAFGAQAYAAGLTRGEVRAQVRAKRWQRVWTRSLCLHTGPVSSLGRQWAAVVRECRRDGR